MSLKELSIYSLNVVHQVELMGKFKYWPWAGLRQ